jgi:hypothetical protein
MKTILIILGIGVLIVVVIGVICVFLAPDEGEIKIKK